MGFNSGLKGLNIIGRLQIRINKMQLFLKFITPRPRYQLATVLVDSTWSCMYSYVLLMMGEGTAWNMYSVL